MLAIVVQAVLRVGRRALHNRALVGIAVAAFLALAVFAVPFPLVVLGARRRRVGCSAGGDRTVMAVPQPPGARGRRRRR